MVLSVSLISKCDRKEGGKKNQRVVKKREIILKSFSLPA